MSKPPMPDEQPIDDQPPRRGGANIWLLELAALTVAAVLAVYSTGGRESQQSQPEPKASPAMVEQRVHVRIAALPRDAVLTVDGDAVTNPYEDERASSDREHVVRASREGYEPVERRVQFDADRDIHLELMPAPGSNAPAR